MSRVVQWALFLAAVAAIAVGAFTGDKQWGDVFVVLAIAWVLVTFMRVMTE